MKTIHNITILQGTALLPTDLPLGLSVTAISSTHISFNSIFHPGSPTSRINSAQTYRERTIYLSRTSTNLGGMLSDV